MSWYSTGSGVCVSHARFLQGPDFYIAKWGTNEIKLNLFPYPWPPTAKLKNTGATFAELLTKWLGGLPVK